MFLGQPLHISFDKQVQAEQREEVIRAWTHITVCSEPLPAGWASSGWYRVQVSQENLPTPDFGGAGKGWMPLSHPCTAQHEHTIWKKMITWNVVQQSSLAVLAFSLPPHPTRARRTRRISCLSSNCEAAGISPEVFPRLQSCVAQNAQQF